MAHDGRRSEKNCTKLGDSGGQLESMYIYRARTAVGTRRGGRAPCNSLGSAPCNRGFWAATKVLDVRAWHGRCSFEALVEWEGTDPGTGDPWEPSWVHARQLSLPLRQAAIAEWGRAPRAAAPAFRERPAGARKSPRLAEGGEGGESPTRMGAAKRPRRGVVED